MLIKYEPVYKVNPDCDLERLQNVAKATNDYIARGEEVILCLGHSGEDPDQLSVSVGIASNFIVEGETLYADLEIDEVWENQRELKSYNKKSVELWNDNVISSVSLLCRNRPALELSVIQYQAPERGDCKKETYMYEDTEDINMSNMSEIKQLFSEMLEHSELQAQTKQIMEQLNALQGLIKKQEELKVKEAAEEAVAEDVVPETSAAEDINTVEGEATVAEPMEPVKSEEEEVAEEASEVADEVEDVKEEVAEVEDAPEGEVKEEVEDVKEEVEEVVEEPQQEAEEDVQEVEEAPAEAKEEAKEEVKEETDAVDESQDSQVKIGFKYESNEHPDLTSQQVLKIVADHLLEDPNYYKDMKVEKNEMNESSSSANNTYLPKLMKKYQMSKDLVSEYQEKLLASEKENAELLKKYQYESRKGELLELSKVYNFNHEEELEIVAKLDNEQWEKHKNIVVTRYQKMPVGRTVDPVTETPMADSQVIRAEKAKAARKIALAEGIDFKTAMNRVQ